MEGTKNRKKQKNFKKRGHLKHEKLRSNQCKL